MFHWVGSGGQYVWNIQKWHYNIFIIGLRWEWVGVIYIYNNKTKLRLGEKMSSAETSNAETSNIMYTLVVRSFCGKSEDEYTQ